MERGKVNFTLPLSIISDLLTHQQLQISFTTFSQSRNNSPEKRRSTCRHQFCRLSAISYFPHILLHYAAFVVCQTANNEKHHPEHKGGAGEVCR